MLVFPTTQASATWYVQEGNLTWQDEFDGVELDEASAAEAGEGFMGLEYWWQHEEVRGVLGLCRVSLEKLR